LEALVHALNAHGRIGRNVDCEAAGRVLVSIAFARCVLAVIMISRQALAGVVANKLNHIDGGREEWKKYQQ